MELKEDMRQNQNLLNHSCLLNSSGHQTKQEPYFIKDKSNWQHSMQKKDLRAQGECSVLSFLFFLFFQKTYKNFPQFFSSSSYFLYFFFLTFPLQSCCSVKNFVACYACRTNVEPRHAPSTRSSRWNRW